MATLVYSMPQNSVMLVVLTQCVVAPSDEWRGAYGESVDPGGADHTEGHSGGDLGAVEALDNHVVSVVADDQHGANGHGSEDGADPGVDYGTPGMDTNTYC